MKEDLISIGRSIRNKKAAEIIDEINEKVHNWNYYASEAGVDKEKTKAINKTLDVPFSPNFDFMQS